MEITTSKPAKAVLAATNTSTEEVTVGRGGAHNGVHGAQGGRNSSQLIHQGHGRVLQRHGDGKSIPVPLGTDAVQQLGEFRNLNVKCRVAEVGAEDLIGGIVQCR